MNDEPHGEELTVHKGRPVGMTVSVRLKPEEARLLTALARRHGRTVSETLRLAIHAIATPADYQTLKLQTGTGQFTAGQPRLERELITA